MSLGKVFQVLMLGIVLSGGSGSVQLRCPLDSRDDEVATRFVVSVGSVKLPIGAFLLVRKKAEIGAIRLTSIDPAATEWLGKSVYESYFQGDGSGSLVAKNVVRRTGELNLQSLKGPGRGIYIYVPGPYKAQIGNCSFSFGSPT
jgi:hypothetical protein